MPTAIANNGRKSITHSPNVANPEIAKVPTAKLIYLSKSHAAP